MILDATTKSLEVVLSAAPAANQLPIVSTWADITTTAFTPGESDTGTNGVTPVTIVAAPAAATQRIVKEISIFNTDTVMAVVTVRYNNNGTIRTITKISLIPGDTLLYREGVGWMTLDSYGNILQATQTRVAFVQEYNAVVDFGFVGDLVTVFDGAMNSGSSTLTCATSAPFATTDVGKRITVARAGASNVQLTSTIIGFTSSSVVTLGNSAGSTVTNSGVSFGTDNSAAITSMMNAVNNATFPGARIIFPRSSTNAYGFPAQVTFNKPVQLEGMGGGHTADTGDYTKIGGTRLAWWGTSLDGGVNFKPFIEVSPSGVQSLKRVAFRHCWLDCRNGDQNEAIIGLKLASCHGFMLEDFFIMDAAAITLWTNIDPDPTEAKDTTRFYIENFCARMLDNPVEAVTSGVTTSSAVTLTTTPQSLTVTANSLPSDGYVWIETSIGRPVLVRYTGGGGTTTLTGCVISSEDSIHSPTTVSGSNVVQAVPGNGCCQLFNGGTAANTCCGTVNQQQLSHGTTWGPAAIELCNADSIHFMQSFINGGNATNDGAINRIRKPGVRFNGSNVTATLASRNNVFIGDSAGAGGVIVMGVLNTAARMLAMATPNYWELYQMGNGEPVPVVEGSTSFDWNPNGGWRSTVNAPVSIADQAISAATLTLLTGSMLCVPPQGFQIGTKFRWTIIGTGSAAGTAANTITVRCGTNGTTSDAAVATFTTSVGTAAASEFVITIELTVRTLGASATAVAECWINNSAAAGFINALVNVLAGTMTSFNSTTAQQFIHVCLSTGASKTATIKQVSAEIIKPANP